jgi:hypothetical protein
MDVNIEKTKVVIFPLRSKVIQLIIKLSNPP